MQRHGQGLEGGIAVEVRPERIDELRLRQSAMRGGDEHLEHSERLAWHLGRERNGHVITDDLEASRVKTRWARAKP